MDSDRHRSEPKNLSNNWDSSESKSKDALPSHSAVLSGENFYQDADGNLDVRIPSREVTWYVSPRMGLKGLFVPVCLLNPDTTKAMINLQRKNSTRYLPGSFDRKPLFRWSRRQATASPEIKVWGFSFMFRSSIVHCVTNMLRLS